MPRVEKIRSGERIMAYDLTKKLNELIDLVNNIEERINSLDTRTITLQTMGPSFHA